MTTDEHIRKLDDEILSLSHWEDKLQRAMKCEGGETDDWYAMPRQLQYIQRRLDRLQIEAANVASLGVAEARAMARRAIWPPVVPRPLVQFFAIEEAKALEAAA